MLARRFSRNAPISLTLVRKTPWRISMHQKRRQRKRLRIVDNVVSTLNKSLTANKQPVTRSITRWNTEMPREEEMLPKDKYTMFDRKERKYRKGIHSSLYKISLITLHLSKLTNTQNCLNGRVLVRDLIRLAFSRTLDFVIRTLCPLHLRRPSARGHLWRASNGIQHKVERTRILPALAERSVAFV